MPANIPPWLLPSDPSIEPPDAGPPNFYAPTNLPPGVTTFPSSGPYTPPMSIPFVQPPDVNVPSGPGGDLPPYMYTFAGQPDASPTATPYPSSPGPYQPGIDISQNPFASPAFTPSYDPATNPMVWAPNPANFDPTTGQPYGGIPAPGTGDPTDPNNLYGGAPAGADPSQPDLNVPFGSAGAPGAPNLTPSPYAVGALTTLPATLGPNPVMSNIGGSGYQSALFHGVWFGHQPMDFATWNAGAGTPQAWAARPGGTYQNYLNIWRSLRSGPATAQAKLGPGAWSGQGPGGAGRPVTSAR